jgi:hypothetical protein
MTAVTLDLDVDDAVPYFLTDLDMTLGRLKQVLSAGPPEHRDALLARLLSDAIPSDVWKLTTPGEVWSRWDRIAPRLGWTRPMWTFIFDCWRQDGLVP